MANMIIARFKDNETAAETDKLRQWDYGQTLRIEGLSLPDMVEVHFSIRDVGGDAERQIGTTKDGVTEVSIPDKMLENKHCKCSEYTIYAWVYLSDETSGQTEYDIRIPVETRSRPVNFAPSNQPDFAGKVMEKLNDVETLKADFDGLKKESDERDKQKLTRPESAKAGQIFRVQAVNEDGTLVLEAVDMPECDVTDVQIDGTSIVGENGVAEIPNAKNGIAGLVAPCKPLGTNVQRNGILSADSMTTGEYDKASVSAFIGKGTLETSKYNIVKKALSDGKGEAWSEEEQAAARARMGVERGTYATGKIVFDEETKIVNVDISSLLSEKDEITDVYVLIESDKVVSAGSGNITSDTTNGIIGFFGLMSFSESQKRFVRMHTFVESDICVCECSSGNGNETSGNYLVWQYYKNSMINSGSLKKARKFTLSINATMSQGDTAEFYFAYRKGTYA